MRNPVEDVWRSVRALPGRFSQLLYLASLRDRTGDYQHWGLTREYGDARTAAAFRHCHRKTYDGLLQTEFSELLDMLHAQCQQSGGESGAILSELLHEGRVKPAGTEE